MAVMLGPSGIGLMGTFSSIADLTRSVAQFGINSSGVRQIAEAASGGDTVGVARIATLLRRISVLLAVIGGFVLFAASELIASFTFGSGDHRTAIALLSLAVASRLLAEGYGSILQGLRRVADMSKGTVVGALFGTSLAIPLVFWFGEAGVVPSLIVVATASLAINWWYAHRVALPRVSVGMRDLREKGVELIRLGVAFMISGLLMMGAAYLVRIIVLRQEGVEAVGYFQAAWAIGGMYVGFVLQAMGADFYPRLVGVSANNESSNRLVNEQTEVSTLLAAPGVMATLVFAPLVLPLFYSSQFGGAIDVLRWMCVGVALRVVSWPMGFVILARNAQRVYMLTELAWAVVNVLVTWIAVSLLGVVGAGIAFVVSYAFHIVMIRLVVGKMTNFRWSRRNRWLIGSFLGLSSISLGAQSMPFATLGVVISGAALVASIVVTILGLGQLMAGDRLPRQLQRPMAMLRRLFAARA